MTGGTTEAVPPGVRVSWYAMLRLLPPLIWVPLIAVLLASLVVVGMSELAARRAQANNARIAEVLLRLEALAEVRTLMVDAETGQRGYLLTGDPEYLEPFAIAARGLPASIARLRELSAGAGPVEDALNRAGALMAETLTAASNIVREYESAGGDAAIALMQAGDQRRLREAVRGTLAELDALTLAELDALHGARLASARWARARLLAMTLVSLGLLVMLTRQFAVAALRQERRRHAAEHEAQALERIVSMRTRELSQLSTHLQSYAEEEKSALAHDLHDELGGLLTAAKMDLSWLQGRISEPPIEQRLAQLGRALDEAMDVKRRVVEDLRPSLLDHFGLSTALRAYLDSACRKAAIGCHTAIDDSLDASIPKETATALFRVVQEGLTNVVRHARAKTVRVQLASARGRYMLSIRDDGCGFDAASAEARSSHGIAGMRHRIRALNGSLLVDSARGRGTQLIVEVPCDAHLERASATSGLSSEMSRILSRK